jgi:signal transduction histidine kinase
MSTAGQPDIMTATLAGLPRPEARTRPVLRALATVLAITAVVAVVVAGVLSASAGRGLHVMLVEHHLVASIVASSLAVVAAVVLRAYPSHALGWVFLAVALLEAASVLGTAYALRRPALPLAGVAGLAGDRIWYPGMVLAAALITPLFPDGRPLGRRWRPLIGVGAALVAVSAVVIWLLDLPADDVTRWRSPLTLPAAAQPALAVVGEAIVLAAAGCGLVGALGLLLRMRRSAGAERRRIAWFFVAFVVGVLAQFLDGAFPVVPLVAWGLFPFALGVAMLRYGLFDGDRLLNRTLVYTILTVAVAGVFALAIGLASAWLGGEGVAAVIAAVVIALGLAPAQDLVQRGVDRLLYGQRRDPYSALTGLGRQLSSAIAPDRVAPIVVDTVATALRLPYVALTFAGDRAPAASRGTPTATTVDLPMRHAGTDVGTLTVGLPTGQRFLDPGDERLLHGLTHQAAAAADSVRLTRELRRSRDDLAFARDEERHRIRRDLHDGLGPTLAGVALGLGAAKRSATTPEMAQLVGDLETDVRGSLDDVKRLVADLRPATLEHTGLVGALRRYADTVTFRSGGTLTVRVEAPDQLPPLPPPVEVAAYRIVLEAVTNVTKHSEARQCAVRVDVPDNHLELTVTDDGAGIASTREHPGLGLRSIAERATELGGRATAGPGADGGYTVHALIPVGRRP